MNILIISALADSSGLGVRLKAEGHNVLYYIHSEAEKETCDGILDKVEDWREHVEESDMVIFDDVDQKEPGESAYQGGKWYEEMREKYLDKAIIGGSSWASKLENDRMFGQGVLQACAVPTVPMHRFTDFDDAIGFVSKEGGGWALKHNGQVNRALAHVSFDPEDMQEYLEWLDEHWQVLAPGHKPDFVLQQAIKGLELAVTCFFDGEKFRPETCYLNREIKRFMPGDYGPPTGQMGEVGIAIPNARLFQVMLKPLEGVLRENGFCQFIDVNCIVASPDTVVPLEFTCYDDQTEILTKEGWKRFAELRVGELVATLNPDTGELEYRPVANVIAKPYKGKMIHFTAKDKKHSATDLCVTPDHSMWVRNIHSDCFAFVPAERVAAGGGWYTKRTALWKGIDREVFVLPGYVEEHGLGRHGGTFPIEHPPVEIPMEVWLRFLGLYLAEGSIAGRDHIVSISQPGAKHAIVREMLKDLPWPVHERPNGVFEISSTQLARYLKPLGKCNEKYIPAEFKELSPRYLNILLDALMIGDGSQHKRTGQRVFYTTSRRLADDVQELMLKTGRVGVVKKVRVRGTKMAINGTTYERRFDGYCVSERTVKTDGYLDKRLVNEVDYEGVVYCCNVPPHHLIYARRNGKPIWCGNCRPGYPTIYSIIEAADEPIGEMLYKLATRSTDPVRLYPGFIVTVVVATNRFPYPDPLNRFCYLRGADRIGLRHVHLAAVKYEKDQLRGADDSGYLAVVTGRGRTIEEARRKAFGIVEQLEAVPFALVRNDVGAEQFQQEFAKLANWGWLS